MCRCKMRVRADADCFDSGRFLMSSSPSAESVSFQRQQVDSAPESFSLDGNPSTSIDYVASSPSFAFPGFQGRAVEPGVLLNGSSLSALTAIGHVSSAGGLLRDETAASGVHGHWPPDGHLSFSPAGARQETQHAQWSTAFNSHGMATDVFGVDSSVGPSNARQLHTDSMVAAPSIGSSRTIPNGAGATTSTLIPSRAPPAREAITGAEPISYQSPQTWTNPPWLIHFPTLEDITDLNTVMQILRSYHSHL